jgi:YgiT-type zinc finger domain-containing protein
MSTCAACHNPMVRKTGIIDLRIREKLYVVRNVTYDTCEFCGEKALSPDKSREIYKNIKNRKYIEELKNLSEN